MKILTAIDYGFRKVIRVVMDDSIPEWMHPDGSLHTDATARGPSKHVVIKADPLRGIEAFEGQVPGDLTPGLAPGTECHDCRHNWDIREAVFTGRELYSGDRLKTIDELWAEALVRLGSAPVRRTIALPASGGGGE